MVKPEELSGITPGPWYLRQDRYGWYIGRDEIGGSGIPHSVEIAHVRCGADAKLIAAAPEIYGEMLRLKTEVDELKKHLAGTQYNQPEEPFEEDLGDA